MDVLETGEKTIEDFIVDTCHSKVYENMSGKLQDKAIDFVIEIFETEVLYDVTIDFYGNLTIQDDRMQYEHAPYVESPNEDMYYEICQSIGETRENLINNMDDILLDLEKVQS